MSTKIELVCIAKELGLTDYTGMDKADLEKFIKDHTPKKLRVKRPKKTTPPEPEPEPAPAPAPVKVKKKKPLAEQKKFKAGVAKVKETLAKGKAENLLKKAMAKYKAQKAQKAEAKFEADWKAQQAQEEKYLAIDDRDEFFEIILDMERGKLEGRPVHLLQERARQQSLQMAKDGLDLNTILGRRGGIYTWVDYQDVFGHGASQEFISEWIFDLMDEVIKNSKGKDKTTNKALKEYFEEKLNTHSNYIDDYIALTEEFYKKRPLSKHIEAKKLDSSLGLNRNNAKLYNFEEAEKALTDYYKEQGFVKLADKFAKDYMTNALKYNKDNRTQLYLWKTKKSDGRFEIHGAFPSDAQLAPDAEEKKKERKEKRKETLAENAKAQKEKALSAGIPQGEKNAKIYNRDELIEALEAAGYKAGESLRNKDPEKQFLAYVARKNVIIKPYPKN